MASSFAVSVRLKLRDLFGDRLRGVFRRAEDDAKKTGKRMGDNLRKGIGQRAAGLGRAAIGGAGAVVGVGLVGSLAQAGARVRDFETTLEDVRVQMGRTRPEAAELRQAIKDISAETGVSRSVILDGASAIANLQGNTSELNEKLDVLARAHVAARAPVEELASTWDSLDKAFFRGQGSARDMEDALSAAIEAGKQGSIPLSQMGALLGRVATQFDDVTTSGKAGIADMVAALQVVKGRGFGEAAEAATGMNAAIKQLIARSKDLKKLGVEVFDVKNGKRQLKDLRSILDQFAKRGLEDPLKLQDALKESEAIRFIGALLDKDVRAKWDEIAEAATNANTTQDDYAAKQETTGAKITKSLNQISAAMDDAFTPERVEAFASALTAAIAAAGALAGAVTDIGTSVGEAAAEFAVLAGWAGRKEELGTPEAVAKDLSDRERMAQERAEAAKLGVLEGNVISERAIEETAEERERAGQWWRTDQEELSPQARAVAALLKQRSEGVGLRTGIVAAPTTLGGEMSGLEAQMAQDQAKEQRFQREEAVIGFSQKSAELGALASELRVDQERAMLQATTALADVAKSLHDSARALGSAANPFKDAADRALLDYQAKNAPPTGSR